MMFLSAMLLAALVAASTPVCAAELMHGTPKERAACRPDVRRFCQALKPGSDAFDFLACLQDNRSQLRAACRAVLENHGQ